MSDLTASAQQTDAGATGGTQPGAGTPPAPQPEAPKFTQDDVNRMLADEKRKLKQQQDDAAAKIKREAEEKAALEKGEYEKLASERGSRLAQIEAEYTTTAERVTAYEAEMERQIKARLKALPEAIRDLDPGGDMLTRFAWLPKAEALAASFAAPSPAPRGTPPGARQSSTSSAPNMDAIIAEKRARIGGL